MKKILVIAASVILAVFGASIGYDLAQPPTPRAGLSAACANPFPGSVLQSLIDNFTPGHPVVLNGNSCYLANTGITIGASTPGTTPTVNGLTIEGNGATIEKTSIDNECNGFPSAGTLQTALTSGALVSTLTVDDTGVGNYPSGHQFTIAIPKTTTTQTFTSNAPTFPHSMSISVNPVDANASYPAAPASNATTVTGAESTCHGLLTIFNTANTTVEGLNLAGPCPCSGQAGNPWEGQFGIETMEDSNITITGVNVSHVQGDGFIGQVNDSTLTGNSNETLTTGLIVTLTNFDNSGYHGLTLEANNGAYFGTDTWNGTGNDAVDFEYDGGSTTFNGATPLVAAEDHITVENSTFTDWQDGWYVSLQAAGNCALKPTPPPCVITGGGVQEQDILFTNNTLVIPSGDENSQNFVQLEGVPLNTTQFKYTYANITVQKTKLITGKLFPTSGGGANPCSAGMGNSINGTTLLSNISGMSLLDNSLNLDTSSGPYMPFVAATSIYGFTVENNTVTNACAIQRPGFPNQSSNVVSCNNTYGAAASPLVDTTNCTPFNT